MPSPTSDSRRPADALLTRARLRQSVQTAVASATDSGRHCAVLIVGVEPKDRLQILTQDWMDSRIAVALQMLPEILRKSDRYAVLGERRCCILLPGLTNMAQAMLAAHKISRDLSNALSGNSNEAWARILIGIACYPEHANDADALIMRADAAQRQADTGEDGIFLFLADPLQGENLELPASRAEVLEALTSNNYRLVYQPQVELASGRCRAAEALLRCTLSNGTRIPPGVLARIAEQEGRVAALTANVLNTALRQMSDWSNDGVDLHLSVNLSPYNLRDHNLPGIVAGAISTWEVEPERVTLELVESSMIHNFDQASDLLNRLKAIGVKLAVDDFGTGYSCLAYLRQLPVDELKVDQALVRNLLRTPADRQLVQATIDLAHNFGLHAVAEGVETMPMLEILSEMQCDTVQGYIISRPIEAADYLDWLTRHEADAFSRGSAPSLIESGER